MHFAYSLPIRITRVYRIALSIFFFIQGIVFASWASRIPDIKTSLGLSDAALGGLLLALPASALLLLLTVLMSALLRWTLLPRLTSGRWPVYGQIYLRRWLTNQIQESSLSVLHGLYASIYAGTWYRLLGAKVGPGTEISTAMGIVPDMLTLGRDSFIADGVMLGDEEIDRGWMTMRPTVIGNRSFVGNGAYVPDGSVLPDDVLIGVQSRARPMPAWPAARPGSAIRRWRCRRVSRRPVFPST